MCTDSCWVRGQRGQASAYYTMCVKCKWKIYSEEPSIMLMYNWDCIWVEYLRCVRWRNNVPSHNAINCGCVKVYLECGLTETFECMRWTCVYCLLFMSSPFRLYVLGGCGVSLIWIKVFFLLLSLEWVTRWKNKLCVAGSLILIKSRFWSIWQCVGCFKLFRKHVLRPCRLRRKIVSTWCLYYAGLSYGSHP